MIGISESVWNVSGDVLSSTQAVVPVLIGPLQTFLAILPSLLVALGGTLAAMFKPSGMKKIVLFFWHQKIFSACVLLLVGGTVYGSANNWWQSGGPAAAATRGQDWSAFRGGPARAGAVAGAREPTTNDAVWAVRPRVAGTFRSTEFKTFYASPAAIGNRIYVSAAEKGPLTDRGAILCLDAANGAVAWTYSPQDFRATFSSPSVVYERDEEGKPNSDEGYVVCGEGLHYTTKARVTCLNLEGKKLWDYRTSSHVESSPCIADGRVYIGAGDDGYYCFDLKPKEGEDGKPNIVWHVEGEKYQDCESSPVVHEGVCYVGLGEGGRAIVALDAQKMGEERWRLPAPYPVFGSPTIGYRLRLVDGKVVKESLLFVGMGNGNFIETAEVVRNKKIEKMKKEGKSEAEIAEAAKALGPIGEVWCINLDDGGSGTPPVEWKFKTRRTVLGGIAFAPPDDSAKPTAQAPVEGKIYFGSRDELFYCVSTAGNRVCKPFDAGAAVISSPAVGKDYVYITTESGTLFCLTSDRLEPKWQAALAGGAMSSPALAQGHIYVGTNLEGFRCIGRVKPPKPVWLKGLTGGVSDRTPMPRLGRFSARYPGAEGGTFEVTAPLMPLAEVVPEPEGDEDPAQPKKYLYAAVSRDGKNELIKFHHGKLGSRTTDPVVWAASFDHPIRVAPAGVCSDIYVVEGGGEDPGTLHKVNAESGQKEWRFELEAGGSGEFAIEGRHLFIWSGPSTLTCLDRHEGGSAVWSTDCPPGGLSVGAPSVTGGLLVAATRCALATLDAATGQMLWCKEPPDVPVFGPVRLTGSVLVATEGGLYRCGLSDGHVEWAATEIGPVAQPPLADSEKVVAVSDSGKLFVLELATGLPWPLTRPRGGKSVPATSIPRLAPVEPVDKTVTPLLLHERVIFGGWKQSGGRGKADLMVLALADHSDMPLLIPPPPKIVTQAVEPTRWCRTSFMGTIQTPLVAIEGQTYFAAEKLGLVFLKHSK